MIHHQATIQTTQVPSCNPHCSCPSLLFIMHPAVSSTHHGLSTTRPHKACTADMMGTWWNQKIKTHCHPNQSVHAIALAMSMRRFLLQGIPKLSQNSRNSRRQFAAVCIMTFMKDQIMRRRVVLQARFNAANVKFTFLRTLLRLAGNAWFKAWFKIVEHNFQRTIRRAEFSTKAKLDFPETVQRLRLLNIRLLTIDA